MCSNISNKYRVLYALHRTVTWFEVRKWQIFWFLIASAILQWLPVYLLGGLIGLTIAKIGLDKIVETVKNAITGR